MHENYDECRLIVMMFTQQWLRKYVQCKCAGNADEMLIILGEIT